MPLGNRTDIPVFPKDHQLHDYLVYDPLQREYYNSRIDIFLTDDDTSFHKLRPYDKITTPLPSPLPADYFTQF